MMVLLFSTFFLILFLKFVNFYTLMGATKFLLCILPSLSLFVHIPVGTAILSRWVWGSKLDSCSEPRNRSSRPESSPLSACGSFSSLAYVVPCPYVFLKSFFWCYRRNFPRCQLIILSGDFAVQNLLKLLFVV